MGSLISPWRELATEELILAGAGLEHWTVVTATAEPMPAAVVAAE